MTLKTIFLAGGAALAFTFAAAAQMQFSHTVEVRRSTSPSPPRTGATRRP